MNTATVDERSLSAADSITPRVIWTVVAVGAVLRIHQYIANRSLWFDEANLAMNVITRTFNELLQPLSNNQAAPIGFLMAEKSASVLFGTGEYALRLIPLLAGLVALWLFTAVARQILAPPEALTAVALFSLLDAPIYFSSEMKQYSSDMTVAIGLVWMGLAMLEQPSNRRLSLVAACAGAISIWLSHPAVFVLAGLGATCLAAVVRSGHRWNLAALALVGVSWIGSFLLSYWFSLRFIIANQNLEAYWANRFVPLPASLGDLAQWERVGLFVRNATWVGIPAAFAVALGAFSLYRRGRGRLALLLLPGAIALGAGALHLYPFNGRLILFLLPLVVSVLAAGIVAIAAAVRKHAGPFAASGVVLLVFAQPVGSAAFHVAVPRTREEARPAIRSYLSGRRAGDALYVYPGANPAYRYYARGANETGPVVLGQSRRTERESYRTEVNQVRGSARVWVIFSHVHRGDYDTDEREYLISYLDSIGTRLTMTQYPGAWLYLYDLSKP